MTTAARPTFDPARGGTGRGEKDLSALSRQYSSRDLPGHTKLKFREQGQGTTDELRSRDFRKDLDEREREKDPKSSVAITGRRAEPPIKRTKVDQVPAASLDADDPLEGDSSDSDDSDDDTAELLAELNKIKKERAAEQNKKDAEKRQEDERIRMENILSGNPLLSYSAGAPKADMKLNWRYHGRRNIPMDHNYKLNKYYDLMDEMTRNGFLTPLYAVEVGARGLPAKSLQTLWKDIGLPRKQVKRRWDDDVVFKNCARSEPDKKGSLFVNDSLRSDFHKKFMEKYIK